jgi:23S rRNA (cytidine1920-2'-O)/16S rRNA (cytidine1409-2'-O)-methyltransferase
MDVSFISVIKLFPALVSITQPDSDWIILIKPQFEVGREKVGKGGIVKDEGDRLDAVKRVLAHAGQFHLENLGLVDSPIEGTDGNREYLAWFKNKKPQA